MEYGKTEIVLSKHKDALNYSAVTFSVIGDSEILIDISHYNDGELTRREPGANLAKDQIPQLIAFLRSLPKHEAK